MLQQIGFEYTSVDQAVSKQIEINNDIDDKQILLTKINDIVERYNILQHEEIQYMKLIMEMHTIIR